MGDERRKASLRLVLVLVLATSPCAHGTPAPNITSPEPMPTSSAPPPPPRSAGAFLRREPWAVPLAATSGALVLVLLGWEALVVSRERRHVFLSQSLLLGLLLSSAAPLAFTWVPSAASCGVRRAAASIAFALLFSSLLVKCVLLLGMEAGVYLPALYQALLLLLALLAQTLLVVQWMVWAPPGTSTFGLCLAPFRQWAVALAYGALLLVLVALLALKARGVRDNDGEAGRIAMAAGLLVPVWIGWVLASLLLPATQLDLCLGAGLLVSSGVTFFTVCLPSAPRLIRRRGRRGGRAGGRGGQGGGHRRQCCPPTLRRQRDDDDDEEFDDEDGMSASGYSPSFFHWQPLRPLGQDTCKPIQDGISFISPPPPPVFPGRMVHYTPPCYYPGNYAGLPSKVEEGTTPYMTLEPTMSSNPNVFFHRGLMY